MTRSMLVAGSEVGGEASRSSQALNDEDRRQPSDM